MQHAVQCTVFGLTSGILLAGGNQAIATGWEFSPNITLSEIYLQNSGQALVNQSDNDYITELTPSIELRREGQRVKLNLYYRMQNLWYYNTSDLNNTYNQYTADLSTELVRDIFFLELGATRTQQILDPNSVVTFDNLTTTANRSDVDTYSVKPSLQYQFGSLAKAQASVSYDRVSYDGSNSAGTDDIGYSASLASGDRFDRVSWAGSFNRIEYQRNDNRSDEFTQALLLDFGYQIKKRLTAIAGVGYEDSNIQQSNAGESGGSWKVGAKWDPSLRTSVTGTVGQRFYGNSAFFEVRHKQRKSEWQVSYTENITHVSQLVLGSDLFGNTSPPPEDSALVTTGNPSIKPVINTPSVTTGLFLSKIWNASYQKRTFRSQVNLRGFYEDRDLQVDGDSDKIFGASASLSWAVGSHTTAAISGDLQRQKLVANGKQDDDIWSAGLELSHELGVNSVASISARRVKRDSPSSPLNYEQNQIGATLVIGL